MSKNHRGAGEKKLERGCKRGKMQNKDKEESDMREIEFVATNYPSGLTDER